MIGLGGLGGCGRRVGCGILMCRRAGFGAGGGWGGDRLAGGGRCRLRCSIGLITIRLLVSCLRRG